MSSKMLRKLQKFMEKQERKGEMLPKLKKSKPRSLPGVVCSICLQYMMLPCKISKQKLAGNAAKHQEKLWKISVHAQKISSQQK
jgi:hypothetical protein